MKISVRAAGREVELDFASVEVLRSSFFNACISFLLRDFEPEYLKRKFKVSHLPPESGAVLGRIIENSRRYFGNAGKENGVEKV